MVLSLLAQASSQFDYNTLDSSYYTTTTTSDTAAAGLAIGMLLAFFVFAVIAYVFFAVCLMKIFKKAGRQDSWAAWVPIYNSWVYFEIAGKPGWWSLVGLIPFVGGILALVFSIVASIELAKAFGKSGGFAALLILLPVIGLPMLAFGDAQYTTPVVTTAPGAVPPTPPTPPAAPVQ